MLTESIRVFMQGGLLMWPLVLSGLVLYGIILRTLWHLFINVLGSAVGYHKAMTVLAARGLAHPKYLWAGAAEGMVSSIAGLLILAAAGACWYLLRWRFLADRHISR